MLMARGAREPRGLSPELSTTHVLGGPVSTVPLALCAAELASVCGARHVPGSQQGTRGDATHEEGTGQAEWGAGPPMAPSRGLPYD